MLNSSKLNTTSHFFDRALLDLKIDENRRVLLETIASTISQKLAKDGTVNLNFICTHNSRRSQFAQVWGSFASHYFNLENIFSFSGGTAITAFYRNTIASLQEVGFEFTLIEFSHTNPKYHIGFKDSQQPIVGFSKLYDDVENQSPFIAITTCSSADENCPFIPEASHRFHLPFNDPKAFDETAKQEAKYLEANKQIAGEIHFIFEAISKST
jgi:arsenate reductase